MRKILLVAAVAALLPMTLTACGGSSSSGDDDDDGSGSGQPTPTGAHSHYVVNTVSVPSSNDEATAFGLDVGASTTDKPDGTVDNALGRTLAALGGEGFDIKSSLDAAVNEGSITLLADFQSSDATFMNASAAGLQILLGDNASPPPCGSDYGSNGAYNGSDSATDCGKQFSGSGTFGIASDSPTNALVSGPIVNGTFSGGPGSVQLQIALGGATPVTLSLINARAKATGISSTGITSLIIGGAITKDNLDSDVIPAIQAQLQPLITRDCPYALPGTPTSTPPGNNCECDQCQAAAGAGSADQTACVAHTDATSCTADTAHGCIFDDATTGKTVLGLFDTSPKDCTVSVTEILGNQLVASLLAPDVCSMATCVMPDSLSIGIKTTAVAGSYTVTGETNN